MDIVIVNEMGFDSSFGNGSGWNCIDFMVAPK